MREAWRKPDPSGSRLAAARAHDGGHEPGTGAQGVRDVAGRMSSPTGTGFVDDLKEKQRRDRRLLRLFCATVILAFAVIQLVFAVHKYGTESIVAGIVFLITAAGMYYFALFRT